MKPYLSQHISAMSLFLTLASLVCFCLLLHDRGLSWIAGGEKRRFFLSALLGALIGGRLLSVLSNCISGSRGSFFVFYGGLLGTMAGLRLCSRLGGASYAEAEDALFSYLPLGQAIGRIGCYFNGCCYGRQWEGFPGVRYPVDGQWLTVFPTWFAESAFCLLLFFFLRKFRIRNLPRATLYFMAYGVWRFFIEFFRGDQERGLLFGVSVSQIISVILVISAIISAAHQLHKGEVYHARTKSHRSVENESDK